MNTLKHNPDSNCIECCIILESVRELIAKVNSVVEGMNDPNVKVPPMLKMLLPMLGLNK